MELAQGISARKHAAGVGKTVDVLVDLARNAETGVLMVSHDLPQVRRGADHVTLLDGVVRRSGPPAVVLAEDIERSFAPAAEHAP